MRAGGMIGVMFFMVCALSAVLTEGVIASTLLDLQRADRVRIKTWVEPRENIVARQRVNLQIEISTDKRFSGGTRIGVPDVKDAVVLQREKFAMNSTRNEGGRDWTVQQWTLVVYPQRDGVFEIPAITVRLSIAGEEPISGELETLPLRFVAQTPEAMRDKTHWIATTRFEVAENYDKTFNDLKPGDAVTRSISMSADDVPAMMLPDIAVDNLPGVAVYPKPPRLEDRVNRGNYLAERTQVITYVFEKPGEYQLPKQTFYWWNLKTQSVESIELDDHILKVGDLAGTADDILERQQSTDQNALVELVPLLIKISIGFVFVLVAAVVVRKLGKILTLARSKDEPLSEKALRKQFEVACRKNDLHSALGLFYRWMDNYGGKDFKGSVRERLIEIDQEPLTKSFTKLMRAMYTQEQNDEIDLKLFANQFISELRKLDRRSVFDRFHVELKLHGLTT